MSQNARIGKSLPVISQVNVARVSLRSQTIADWQNAINSARNVVMPRRKQLLELYENLMLDGHYCAVINKRTTNVTNKRVVWVEEGATEDQLKVINENIIETPWFHEFLGLSMEVVPYGCTVIELIPEGGQIARCEVVPRANVVPEFGHIAEDATNPMQPWLMYRDDPYYSKYLIEVGKPKDLGAMMIALPYILYKRGVLGDYAQFMELFGMPFRVGKYNPYDDATRQKLMTALSEMGGAGYTVIPDGTSLEFIQASSGTGQGDNYKGLFDICNSEVSKIFLGQTMTTDNGSSRSQSEVHKTVEEDITLADMRRIEFLLNWELKDRLERLGYPVAKGRFAFDRTMNLSMDKRILIDEKVAQQLGGLPTSYWRETYNIPEPTPEELKELEAKEQVKADAAKALLEANTKEVPAVPAKKAATKPEKEPEPKPEPAEKKKAKPRATASLNSELEQWYAPCTHDHNARATAAATPTPEGSDVIMETLAQAIHDGRITEGWVDPALMQWTADQLTSAVMGGFEIADDAPAQSKELLATMRNNVHVFSGFKTYHTLKAATAELVDKDGQFRSFSKFKAAVLAIDAQYNVNYLKTEYQLAVARAQSAEQWQDVQRDKALFPYLKWSTAGDDRVREAHAKLDGHEAPVDDPFWKQYWPPLGWGCRCDVEQLRRLSGGKNLPQSEWPPMPPMFTGNVGIDGAIFPKGHPYYSAPKPVAVEVERLVAAKVAKPKAATKKGLAPMGTPVSAALETKVRKLKPVLKLVMEAIDGVHGDGVLKEIPLKDTKGSSYGLYGHTKRTAVYIKVRTTGSHQHLTLAHEIGHFIDHTALGNGVGGYGSHLQVGKMGGVMKALRDSTTLQGLRNSLANGVVKDVTGTEVQMDLRTQDYYEYLLKPHEQWARAYAQYIATRSGNVDMMRELDQDIALLGAPKQWPHKEFEPIAKAIDLLLQDQGWQTK